MARKVVHIKYPPINHTSHAIHVGPFLFTSGIIGIDYSTGTLAGMNVEDEMRQILLNLQDILRTEGMTFDHVVRVDLHLEKMAYLSDVNKVYSTVFKEGNYPARTVAEVSMLQKNAKVEMSVIAYLEVKS